MWPVCLIWSCDWIRDAQWWDWDSPTFDCNSTTLHGAEERVRSSRLLSSDKALSLCDPREVQSLRIQDTVSQEIIITATDLLPALCLFLESLLLSLPLPPLPPPSHPTSTLSDTHNIVWDLLNSLRHPDLPSALEISQYLNILFFLLSLCAFIVSDPAPIQDPIWYLHASTGGRRHGYQRAVEGEFYLFRCYCLVLTACIFICSGHASSDQLLAAHRHTSPSLKQIAHGHSFESGPVPQPFTVGVDARSVSHVWCDILMVKLTHSSM